MTTRRHVGTIPGVPTRRCVSREGPESTQGRRKQLTAQRPLSRTAALAVTGRKPPVCLMPAINLVAKGRICELSASERRAIP
jgi:hypothetical protein